jgi:hypothetical protein
MYYLFLTSPPVTYIISYHIFRPLAPEILSIPSQCHPHTAREGLFPLHGPPRGGEEEEIPRGVRHADCAEATHSEFLLPSYFSSTSLLFSASLLLCIISPLLLAIEEESL